MMWLMETFVDNIAPFFPHGKGTPEIQPPYMEGSLFWGKAGSWESREQTHKAFIPTQGESGRVEGLVNCREDPYLTVHFIRYKFSEVSTVW